MGIVSEHLQALRREKESSRLWDGYVNQLKTLKSLFNSDEHWILEFIQNAEDARSPKMSIRIGEDSIWILNNGDKFTAKNFYSICDVNSKKEPSKGDRGYLGIGFKSIFKLTNKVDIHSGDFHFSFDEGYWDGSERGSVSIEKWPWEILPLEIAVKDLPEDYNTGFYIPMKSKEGQGLLKKLANFFVDDKFPKEAITQLKHIETIEIKTPQRSYIITKPEGGRLIEKLPFGEKEIVIVRKQMDGRNNAEDDKYLVFRKTVLVDPLVLNDKETARVRRSGIKDREIGLIFKLDGKDNLQLWKGKVTGVYSFMPVEGEQTGLPFGVFGDFIPNPGRDLVNYGAGWNDWQCKELVCLTKDVIKGVFLRNENWCNFPAELLQHLYVNSGFWGTKLVEPLKEFLESEPLYEGGHRLEELDIDEDNIADEIGREDFEKITGRKPIKPDNKNKIKQSQKVSNTKASGILKNLRSLEQLKTQPEKLNKIYKKLERTSNTDNKRVLGEGSFVLSANDEYYQPKEVVIFEIDFEKENLPLFLNAIIPHGKKLLHPEIAKDDNAVEQLRECGLNVVRKDILVKELLHLIKNIATQSDCPPSWHYPIDLIEATLFLISQERCPQLSLLIAQDGNLHKPNALFLSGATLNWMPLWSENLLPGYYPLHERYLNERSLQEYKLQREVVQEFLKCSGIHGFAASDDDKLTEKAAYEVAKKRLTNAGHSISKVYNKKELGYDLECKGHCQKVFEVKGMTDPKDISLQPKEYERAKDKGDDCILFCVYHLPNQPEYREIPGFSGICDPVGNAKVLKDKWLRK